MAALLFVVEDVEVVLAVRGGDALEEDHARHILVEEPFAALLEVVAPGEEDAMVLGQLDAGLGDGVHPEGLPPLAVEDEVPPGLLAVGQDAEQDQLAHGGVVDLGVVEGLVRILHRLGVDALARVGVVLHLDREIPADALHEHAVEDVQMRVHALHLVVAGGGMPLELLLGRQLVLRLAAVVEVGQRVVPLDGEAEDAHVPGRVAHLEDQQQAPRLLDELQEAGVLVVLVEFAEVLAEGGVAEQVGLGLLEAAAVELVDAEDILDLGLGLQPDVDVVAEDEMVPDADDVAGDAVVLGGDAVVADDLALLPAEGGLAPGVQRVEPLGQLALEAHEALAQHLVGTAAEFCRRLVVGLVRDGGWLGHGLTSSRPSRADPRSCSSGPGRRPCCPAWPGGWRC